MRPLFTIFFESACSSCHLGLAVGIGFIVIFAGYMNDYTISDNRFSVDNPANYREILDKRQEEIATTEITVIKSNSMFTEARPFTIEAIEQYPLLYEMILEADSHGTVIRNITLSEAEPLIKDSRLAFYKNCYDDGSCNPLERVIRLQGADYWITIYDKDNRYSTFPSAD